MAYSNERINVKLRYKWDGKDAILDLKVKRGMRLTALIEKLATGRACPWTKWNAPKCHHLVHKGTLLDNKRVIGDYSVEPEVLLDMVFSAEEAEALVKAGKGQFDDYRPPHKDMLDDKIKQWDAQGTARRRSTCEFVNVNTVSGFGGTMSGTQALQQPGGTVRRTSVVTLVLEGGQTTMAPIATSSTLTLRQEGESMPPLPARRPSQSTAAAPVEQPKTLERVKVIVEFSNTTSGMAYSHEHVLTRGSKFDDVVASIKAKSFHSSYNDKCVILYKGVVVEPRRSIGDYVASDKVMRCVVARDAEQAEKLRQQTAEEGYRPPYEALIEERRKAREASVQQAADKMRADLPSPRESRSNSTVTITVTTVPLNPEGTGVRRPSMGQEQGQRRPSVGQAAGTLDKTHLTGSL
jgi:hypothetical protein